jgi:hypothetical protein
MKATLALLCWLLLAAKAGAEARITDLRITIDRNQLFATVSLEGAFSHRFLERVESGLPTSILYRFELEPDGRHFWERHGRSNTVEVTARHDAEARSYTLHLRLDDKLIESRTLRDLRSLEAAMSHLERLPVFSLGSREDGKRLVLRVRAELGTRTLLSFIPVAVATDWVSSNRFRPTHPTGGP